MSAPSLDQLAFKLLRDYIHQNCGLDLGEEKMYLVQSRLANLMHEYECDNFTAFYYKAKNDASGRIRDKIVDAVTTHETLWFRDALPFTVMREVLLPQISKRLSGTQNRLRIWSSACSTGQEPYSIAMTILDYLGQTNAFSPSQVDIVATEVSQAALASAKAGLYDSLTMSRGLTQMNRDRYFDQSGSQWSIKEPVRKMVRFQIHNLKDSYALVAPIDIVFCRNVLIYFAEEFKKDILSRMAKALSPGGYLFLGASESLINYSTDFAMMNHGRALYYQVKSAR